MWVIIAAFIIILLLWCWTNNKKDDRFIQLASKLRGAKPLPIIGNAMELGTDSKQFLDNLLRLTETYGQVTKIWLGKILFVIIHSAEDIEAILSSKSIIGKTDTYRYLKPWLGTGLLTANGEKWKKHRKLLTPAFHFNILENYIQAFDHNLQKTLNALELELDKEEFDVQPYIDRSTLDILSETAMATQVQTENNESEFREAIKKASFAILYRTFKPWLHPEFLFNWSITGATFHRSVKTIQDFIKKIILKRKEAYHKNKDINQQTSQDSDFFGYKKRIAFLDLLLELSSSSQQKLTDQDILDEVNTFMFAGHDTTTSAITFALYILSRHPEIQEKVVEEIQEVFGDLDDKPFTINNLSSMKYLERVIKETLRIYPSVPYIGREINEELTLSNGDILPNGCSTIILFHKLHRNPNVFPNPEEFNPDNFLPERVIGRHPFAYCPFSAGPRNCIGQRFAMLEMKATILSILRKYCLLPGKTDIILAPELVLRSSSGIHISIKKRNKNVFIN